MAESIPVLPESASDTGTYRPLSGLAMASIVIAGFYALIVLAFASLSFVSGTPIFLPPWGLVAPVTAIILAAAARRQIRSSEGARSGLALANWGWRLGLFFGITHAAIFFGTMLAVGMQAQSELKTNFFDKLRDGNLEDAYVFTLNPDQRATRDEIRQRFLGMEGGKKGPFAKFREHDIVRALGHGPDSTTESLGIKSIDPSKDGYNVVQDYRITCPEGVYVVQFALRTKDSKDSRKRRWQLVWKDTDTLVVSKELTPLGEKMAYWQDMARQFAEKWRLQRNLGLIDLAFLDSCPSSIRLERNRQYLAGIMTATLAGGAAAMGDGGQGLPLARFGPLLDKKLGCTLCMPGFELYSSGKFLDKTEFEASRKSREQILQDIYDNFLRPDILGMRTEGSLGVIRRVEGDRPHLQASISFEMGMRGDDGPKFSGVADLIVESDRLPESEAGIPEWRAVGIKLLSAGAPPSGGPPGGPPGGMSGMMGTGQTGRIAPKGDQ
jgi:hypothetical protein